MCISRISHQLTWLARLQVRPRHKTRGSVLGVEWVHHHDESNQRPPVGPMFDIYVKGFHRRTRLEGSCAHATEFEGSANDQSTSSQQRAVDIDWVELCPSIDKVIDACRRSYPYVSRIGRRYRMIVGQGQPLQAARNGWPWKDDEPHIA